MFLRVFVNRSVPKEVPYATNERHKSHQISDPLNIQEQRMCRYSIRCYSKSSRATVVPIRTQV